MIKGPKNLIYGLIDPRTRMIRYVGMSTSGMSRPKAHRAPSCPDTYCRNWVKALEREGLTYEIAILEVLEDILEDARRLSKAERWWIAYGRMSGWPLTNLTDGGALTRAGAAKKKLKQIARASAPDRARDRSLRNLAAFQALCSFPSRTQAEITSACFRIFDERVAEPHVILDAVVRARVSYETARLLYREWLGLFHVADLKLAKMKIFQLGASGIVERVALNNMLSKHAVTRRKRTAKRSRFSGNDARFRDKLIALRERLLLETAYQREF